MARPTPHAPHEAPDLEGWERPLAERLATLPPVELTPADVARLRLACGVGSRRRWAAAVAALAAGLVLALGLGWLGDAARRAASDGAATYARGGAARRGAREGAARHVVVVEDPSVPLFHGLEGLGFDGEVAVFPSSPPRGGG